MTRYACVAEAAPAVTPFVAPETLERERGQPFRLRLGANESPFGPSPRAIEAMRSHATQANLYGDPRSEALRDRLSSLHRYPKAGIVVTSGIDEALALMVRLFVNPGERVATTVGSYPTFEHGAHAAGAEITRTPYRGHRPDLETLGQDARLVYLANPDNPSGGYHDAASVEALRKRLPSGTVLLLDEAYADFVPSQELPAFDPEDPGVVRLRTFSKAHGLAGLRVGYALMHQAHAAMLDRIRLHFGVNRPAQAAALASLDDPEHLSRVVQETDRNRERLNELARAYGMEPLPSRTNFVTMLLETREKAERLQDDLLADGIFVRKPGQPPLDRGIRITIGTGTDLDALEASLGRLRTEDHRRAA